MLLIFQAPAEAQPAVPLISIGIRGGLSTYAMSDMNVAINDVNDALDAQRFDELKDFGSGPTGGGELRVRVRHNIAVSLTVDYLYETSKVGLEVVGQQFRELEIHASTMPITARLLYVTSNPKNSKLVYSMGGGISYLALGRLKTQSSEIIVPSEHFPSPFLRTADGKGMGFQALAGVEYFVRPWFSVGGELSYRRAKISEISYNDNGAPVLVGDQEISMDFSGVCFNSCLRFHL